GVNTLDDWIEKRGKILEYATHEWVRFTADKFDPRHPERAATLPEWTRVQERFAEWCGPPGDVQLAPLAKCRPNVEHLKKQCIGLLNTILVHERRPIDSNDTFVQEALYTLVEVCEDRDMAEEHRQRAFELRVPYSDFGN